MKKPSKNTKNRRSASENSRAHNKPRHMGIERLEPRCVLSATVLAAAAPPPPQEFPVANFDQPTAASPELLTISRTMAGLDRVQGLVTEAMSQELPSELQLPPPLPPAPPSEFATAPTGLPELVPLIGPPPSFSSPQGNLVVGSQVDPNDRPPPAGQTLHQLPPVSFHGAPFTMVTPGLFTAFAPNGLRHGQFPNGPFELDLLLPMTGWLTLVTTMHDGNVGPTAGNPLPTTVVSTSATAAAPVESISDATGGAISFKGETVYHMKTAVAAEADLSKSANGPLSVASEMGRVELVEAETPAPAGGSESMAMLDISAPEAALQNPDAESRMARSIVVSHEELALDRAMGHSSALVLGGSNESSDMARDEAIAQGNPAPSDRVIVDTQKPDKEAEAEAAPTSWRQRMASSVAVMLFAFDRLLSGKRREEDNVEQPAGKRT